jgi:hypothetical protein
MALTQTNLDKPGYETRNFYCLRCGNTEKQSFKINSNMR